MNWLTRWLASYRDYLGNWGSGDKQLAMLFGRGPTMAGVDITEETALNLSAVWACVQLIAGNLASLPLLHYRRLANGDRERADDTKLYHVLHGEPNREMSAVTFLETLQMHVLLWGNAFALITRDNSNRVVELYPIEPWRVSGVRQAGIAGPLRYRIAQSDGTDAVLPPEEVLHVPGLSPNGVWGYSVIRKARESYGLTMAQERFAATFFGKGSQFGGILTHPNALSPENEERLRKSLENRHQGPERAHQFVILQNGMTYTQLGIPNRDAQFLQLRAFQLGEVARWFGVPPHLIGDVEKSTSWGSGIQQQTLGFLQFTLRKWLEKWEAELNRKLISPLERNRQYIEFLVDALERADQESRYRAYQVAILSGFMTRNEVRKLENLPEIEGGDTPLVPANMTTEEKISAPTPAPAPATPAAEEPADEEPQEDDRAVEFQQLVALGKEVLAGQAAMAEHLNGLPPPQQLDLTPILDQVRATTPAPTDLTPVLERLDAVEAVKGRLAGMVMPVRGVIEGAVRDFVRREADRARRASTSPEKLAEWAERFYPCQPDYAVNTLRHALQLYSVLVGRPDGTEALIRDQVGQYVTESRDALGALLQTPPADLKGAVETLTGRWEAERPRRLADVLMQDVLTV